MKKLFLALILTLLFITGIGFFAKNRISQFPKPTATPISNTAEISIDFGEGKIINYVSDITANLTAFDLLKKASEINSIQVESKNFDFGVFVEEIGGKANTSQKAWIYFINGKSAEVGADKYILKPNDKIEWKYIKPIF